MVLNDENNYFIIELLVKAIKENNTDYDKINCCIGKGSFRLYDCKYLLNRVLRYVYLSKKQFGITEKALKLWRDKTNDDITEKTHIYGFSCKPKHGKKTKVENIFAEHTVTIHDLIDELVALKEINKRNIKKVLSKMYITYMCKDENCKIKNADRKENKVHGIAKKNLNISRGTTDYRKIIKNIYNNVNIFVIPLSDIK